MTEVHKIRHKLLEALLPLVPFEGWNKDMEALARVAKVSYGEAVLACPDGIQSLVVEFFAHGDSLMEDILQKEGIKNKKSIREKITVSIRTRLAVCAKQKEAMRQATIFFCLPQNMTLGVKTLWGTADSMWNAIGVHDTDFNHYTRRTSLSAVLSSVYLYWFGCEDDEKLQAFISRRLADIMRIEKMKSRLPNYGVQQFVQKLARRRYGEGRFQ